MQCPICNKGELIQGTCSSCGATQRINKSTGNVVYFIGNKLVGMPQDKAERIKMKQEEYNQTKKS